MYFRGQCRVFRSFKTGFQPILTGVQNLSGMSKLLSKTSVESND